MKRFLTLIIAGAVALSCTNRKTWYGDSFQRSVPEREGVLTEGILNFLDEVQSEGIDMHSLMILRHGKVITEGYWYPYKSSYRHIMHSVSKTFTSTAIGFAVQEKRLTVNDKVISFFPADLPAEMPPYLEELAIKHLLTMSVGQEPAPTFYMNDNNWVKSFLATPIVHKPGSVYQYSSYATYMLSAIIQKATGQTLMDYLAPRLLEPLRITGALWEMGAQDMNAGGWGMRIRTEDMAKLGQFYLQEGWWNGKQLLNKEWIKEASSLQIYQRDNLTFEEEMYDNSVQGYGYQIWRCTNNAYRADGANGQFIIVMPDEDAVVAITENTSRTQDVLRMVFKHLQPAMTKKSYTPKDDLREQLSTAVNSLAIPHPFPSVEEVDTFRNQAFSYMFEPNELDLQSVSLQFDGEGNCRYSVVIGGEAYAFGCGLDSWQLGTTTKPSPYFLSPRRCPDGLSPFAVAGYCSRTSADVLCFRLLYVEDYQEETYTCRFRKGELQVAYNHSFEPGAKPVVLNGKQAS
ncbi:hypothetical protein FACS1894181_13550 [Bacteroidia bacterium]|nr:hypothetical protein FACS1894181_13550 [Bacteroidia bacterium]